MGFEGGLLELKLKQLSKLDIDEVILSTNDESSLEIAAAFKNEFSNLKVDRRPEHLASSTTNLSDLIAYVPSITSCDHILWTHVTSPMVNSELYAASIEEYKRSLLEGFDSLMSVNAFKNFLWSKDKNDIVNRIGAKRWPQTQDLEDLYEVNSAIFMASRKIYEHDGDRVGRNPVLFELNKVQALDIDWEEDFKIAEAVYEKIFE